MFIVFYCQFIDCIHLVSGRLWCIRIDAAEKRTDCILFVRFTFPIDSPVAVAVFDVISVYELFIHSASSLFAAALFSLTRLRWIRLSFYLVHDGIFRRHRHEKHCAPFDTFFSSIQLEPFRDLFISFFFIFVQSIGARWYGISRASHTIAYETMNRTRCCLYRNAIFHSRIWSYIIIIGNGSAPC